MTYTTKELERNGVPAVALEMRSWRREQGLSQAELAKLLEVSLSYVQKIERGLMPPPARWQALLEHLRASWTEAMRPARVKPDGRGRYRRAHKGPLPDEGVRS